MKHALAERHGRADLRQTRPTHAPSQPSSHPPSHRLRDAMALLALGGLLLQCWAQCSQVARRRRLERPVASSPAVQRWEGEGGQPLDEPPPQ